MILIEEHPESQIAAKYVDRYQLFIIKEPAFLKTIPNGKMDCYLIKRGEFTKWDIKSESFIPSSKSGILPATNQASFYYIPAYLICLNIKLNLNILSLSLFSGLLSDWERFDMTDLVPKIEQSRMLSRISEDHASIHVQELDAIIKQALSKHSIDEKIEKVLALIEGRLTNKFKVADLANEMNMSEKSMERWIRKQFNLTPKELWQVIRFQQASYNLKNQPNRKLIDSLAYGYYDQSHFIKDCRKITGYAPKAFFSKMKLPTNDIIFE